MTCVAGVAPGVVRFVIPELNVPARLRDCFARAVVYFQRRELLKGAYFAHSALLDCLEGPKGYCNFKDCASGYGMLQRISSMDRSSREYEAVVHVPPDAGYTYPDRPTHTLTPWPGFPYVVPTVEDGRIELWGDSQDGAMATVLKYIGWTENVPSMFEFGQCSMAAPTEYDYDVRALGPHCCYCPLAKAYHPHKRVCIKIRANYRYMEGFGKVTDGALVVEICCPCCGSQSRRKRYVNPGTKESYRVVCTLAWGGAIKSEYAPQPADIPH